MKTIVFTVLVFLSTFGRGEDPLIFVHIPKTAGTSFWHLLQEKFSKEDTPYSDAYSRRTPPGLYYYDLDDKPPDWFARYKLIWGHIFYSQVKNIPARKITFLRDPVKRVLSEHRYWLKYFVYRNVSQDIFCKGHFLPPGDPLYTMNNHQCLFLSGLDPRDPTIPIEKHLKSACTNLRKSFFFVGITEELQVAIYRLYEMMGWEKPTSRPRGESTTDIVEEYSKDLLADIARRNWADIELYKFAQKLFHKKFLITKKRSTS